MKPNTSRTNAEEPSYDNYSYEQKQQFVKKGKQLHNQALLQVLTMIFRRLTQPLRNGFHGTSKGRKPEYFPGKVNTVKPIS